MHAYGRGFQGLADKKGTGLLAKCPMHHILPMKSLFAPHVVGILNIIGTSGMLDPIETLEQRHEQKQQGDLVPHGI